MANYDWIIGVIKDLERFAEIENLDNLCIQLKQTRNAVDLDIQSLTTDKQALDFSKRMALVKC